VRRNDTVLDEEITESVLPVHDRCVRDRPPVEVDPAEAVPVRYGETSCLPSQRQKLEYVGETRLAKTSLDRHQRGSSTMRPFTSVQVRITLEGLRNHASPVVSSTTSMLLASFRGVSVIGSSLSSARIASA